MADDDEFTIEEMIQLELHSVEVLTSFEWCSPIFHQFRSRLTELLDKLRSGQIQAEYAEIELEQIQDAWEQWQKENKIPDD